MTGIETHAGDCRDVLANMPADSIDACVTDPPYHLIAGGLRLHDMESKIGTPSYERGFMGAKWDGGDVAFRPETWAAVLRVLRPGAHLLAFGGTRTSHRMVCAIEDAGFEVRDTLCWLYGSGFPKSLDVSKAIARAAGSKLEDEGERLGEGLCRHIQPPVVGGMPGGTATVGRFHGWGTALKPAHEPIVLARKPLIGTVAANVLTHGTGALNVDACRVQVTGQRPYDIRGAWEPEQRLCASCADPAALSEKPEAPAKKASSATSDAAPISSARAASTSGATSRTDTGCCDGMSGEDTLGNSSIGASGKMPTDPSLTDTLFTTSTATNSTTGLITCSACGVTITPKNTPPTRRMLNGSQPAPQGQGNTEPLGRWPANCLHDGSPEVEAAFAVAGTSESSAGVRNNGNQGHEGWSSGTFRSGPLYSGHADTGSASRFFYCAKADSGDRADSRHPTVKPVDLMRWLVRLITPPGGTVLDPFAGSGTTGEAAMLEGMRAVLIEQDAQHVADIRHRMGRWHGADLPLFTSWPPAEDPADTHMADLFAGHGT